MSNGDEAQSNDPDNVEEWIHSADPVVIAAEIAHAPAPVRSALLNALDEVRTLAVFNILEPAIQAQMLDDMSSDEALALFEALGPDDRARLVEALPAEAAGNLLGLLSHDKRTSTALLLDYPPETAGRIMSPHFVMLRADMTVSQALAAVRRDGADAETIYYLPMVDDDMCFQGAIGLHDLVMAEMSDRIADIREPETGRFPVNADQEVVARYMADADLLAIAVVEQGDRLVGIITVDDAMDVLRFEESEDMARTGAVAHLGQPYFSVSVFKLVRSRVVWLSLLAVAAVLTVNVLAAFESTIEQVVALTLFIPLLIGIGGNTGAQSATTIVRAMAMDDVRTSDFLRVALRESSVGLQMGTALAGLAYLIVWSVFSSKIAAVVALTLIAVCTLAALVGSLMPLLARSIGVDPAVISAPLVTTIVDATGLMIYFLIAIAVLGL
jgi:magnesium transporter